MCDSTHPETGIKCQSRFPNHLDHYVLTPGGLQTWANPGGVVIQQPLRGSKAKPRPVDPRLVKGIREAKAAEDSQPVGTPTRVELPIQGPPKPLPTLTEAFAEAEAGIEQAAEHADTTWVLQAKMVVIIVACSLATFTADDIWERLVAPREPKALGGVIKWAVAMGFIENTDRTTKSVRRHSAPIPIWRSLIVGQNPAEVCARVGLRYEVPEVAPAPDPEKRTLRDYP